MSEYLGFVQVPATTKTERWSVRNKSSQTELGVVKWYGPWRQYCYFPSRPAVYSSGCLDDISRHCRERMEARRKVGA